MGNNEDYCADKSCGDAWRRDACKSETRQSAGCRKTTEQHRFFLRRETRVYDVGV